MMDRKPLLSFHLPEPDGLQRVKRTLGSQRPPELERQVELLESLRPKVPLARLEVVFWKKCLRALVYVGM